MARLCRASFRPPPQSKLTTAQLELTPYNPQNELVADFLAIVVSLEWRLVAKVRDCGASCLKEINQLLNAGYLKHSNWLKARDLARETLSSNTFSFGITRIWLDRAAHADFVLLQKIAQWSNQDIEKFHRLATAVSQCLEEIKTIQNAGYLRTSRWKRIKYQTKKTLNQSNSLENFLDRIHHTDFVLLKQIAELRQINNLVLAGAGTDKTSTQKVDTKEAFEEHKKVRAVTPHQKDFEKEGKLPYIPLIDRLRRQGIPDSVIRKRLQKMGLSEDRISEIFGEGK